MDYPVKNPFVVLVVLVSKDYFDSDIHTYNHPKIALNGKNVNLSYVANSNVPVYEEDL